MLVKLLDLVDGRFAIPLVVIAIGVALAKGVFSLSRSRSQDRRDFLDLFRGHDAQSDVWTNVAVRHAFGAYLPSSLIRQLMSLPQPGRALLEVATAWDFLDMDDETGELRWRRGWLRAARARKVAVRVLDVLYFLLGTTSLGLGYLCMSGALKGSALWIGWVYTVLLGFVAFGCLAYGESLKCAHRAAGRWLGMNS